MDRDNSNNNIHLIVCGADFECWPCDNTFILRAKTMGYIYAVHIVQYIFGASYYQGHVELSL